MITQEDLYRRLWDSGRFREYYLARRHPTYERLFWLIRDVDASLVLDIGCGYGQLVEMCNARGLSARGLDFDVAELKRHHKALGHSSSRFIYGNLCDESVLDALAAEPIDLIVIADALRSIDDAAIVAAIGRLKPRLLVIKEVSNNPWIRRQRRAWSDLRKLSSLEVARLFPGFVPERLYVSRHLLRFNRPSVAAMRLVNALSPTYTIVLRAEPARDV